ncbi:MAG TPA: NAD(P)H-dependent oxidoreductase subunit E [Egibacteraceae bacterium]|nr:NAD(P)H-dependent oxidoreductase subunit E [Egibacteraceae bacterium]
MFAEELRERAEELVGRYPVGRSALLPLLHLVQAQDGMISEDGVAECAELLGLTKAEVMAVATFYSMYKRAPLGRHLVSVCTNFSCKVRGAQEVYDRLAAKLGVGHNETSQDGAITLEHAECLGNCEGAPVVTVDYLNYERLTPEAAEQLVDAVVAGSPPPPTRGFTPPGVREIEYRLAGLGALAAQPSAAEKAEAGAARDDTQPEFARSETLAAEEQAPEELAPASGSGQHGYPGPHPDADDEPGAGDEPAAADAQPDAEDDGGASEEDQDG